MEISRKDIITQFPWIKEKNLHFIISSDYDGLICASFLHHHLNWKLAGYYNLETLWLSDSAIQNKSELIWVDLNILPTQGRTIGGHIVSIDDEIPKGFQTSCNPNILLKLTDKEFYQKFPFSTLLLLMWIHKIYPPNELVAKLLSLHADAAWLKCQHYSDNVEFWKSILLDYNWNKILKGVNTKTFEKRIDQILYPTLSELGAVTRQSKLTSHYLKIKSKQYQSNPDWDEDIILNLFTMFGNYLRWTPPPIPKISHIVNGKRIKLPITQVKKIGLNKFVSLNKVFSYAIPTPRIFNYTSFKTITSKKF